MGVDDILLYCLTYAFVLRLFENFDRQIFWLSRTDSFRIPRLGDRQFQIFLDKYSPLNERRGKRKTEEEKVVKSGFKMRDV